MAIPGIGDLLNLRLWRDISNTSEAGARRGQDSHPPPSRRTSGQKRQVRGTAMGTRLIIIDLADLVTPLVRELQSVLDLEYVETITSDPVNIPDSISHRMHDLNNYHFGEYAVPPNALLPLEPELLEAMAPYEVLALRCLDKFEKPSVFLRRLGFLQSKERLHALVSHHGVSYAERKQIYLRHLRYWNHVITKERINFCICTLIPHVDVDVVVCGLCKVKGIPFITFENLSKIERLMPKEDIWERNYSIGDVYRELQASVGPEDDVELAPTTEKFFRWQTNHHADPVPYEMTLPDFGGHAFHLYGLSQAWKRFLPQLRRRPSVQYYRRIFSQLFSELSYGRQTRALRGFYDRIAQDPIPGEKYMYVALHQQPEQTTATIAGVFVEQINLINMLAYCLPDEVMLYVKEHPAQPGIARNLDFYDELARNPKVRVMSRSANTFRLTEEAIAVATCTGTVGLEALFRGKPVLVFGNVYYDQAPGAFRINSMDDLQAAIETILTGNAGPKLHELRLFLKAVELNSYPGLTDPYSDELKKRLSFTNQDTLRSVVTAIKAKISQKNYKLPRKVVLKNKAY